VDSPYTSHVTIDVTSFAQAGMEVRTPGLAGFDALSSLDTASLEVQLLASVQWCARRSHLEDVGVPVPWPPSVYNRSTSVTVPASVERIAVTRPAVGMHVEVWPIRECRKCGWSRARAVRKQLPVDQHAAWVIRCTDRPGVVGSTEVADGWVAIHTGSTCA
jgi:hypothetical protein